MCQPQPGLREHVDHKRREARVIGVDHRLRRPRRMDVDRRVERLGGFQNGPEELVVEIAAAIVAVDDGADEAAGLHPVFELGGGLVRRRGRQRGEAGKPLRVLLHPRGKEIVDFAGQRDGVGGIELLGAGRSQRQHLHVDAGCVHRRDALVGDIGEALDQPRGAAFEFERRVFQILAGTVEKARRCEVFFKGNDAHRCSFLRPAWYGPFLRRFNLRIIGEPKNSATVIPACAMIARRVPRLRSPLCTGTVTFRAGSVAWMSRQ